MSIWAGVFLALLLSDFTFSDQNVDVETGRAHTENNKTREVTVAEQKQLPFIIDSVTSSRNTIDSKLAAEESLATTAVNQQTTSATGIDISDRPSSVDPITRDDGNARGDIGRPHGFNLLESPDSKGSFDLGRSDSHRAEMNHSDIRLHIPPAEQRVWGGILTNFENRQEQSVRLPDCNFTLDDLGDLCSGPTWSCQNRCGEDSPTNGSSQPGTCHCSHKCLMYSSCCEDFQLECPAEHEEARKELEKFDGNEAQCDPKLSFKLVSICTLDSDDPLLKQKCEVPQSFASFEMNFPVTDSLNGHHFRNKACWECWQQQGLDFGEPIPWEVSVKLEKYVDSSSHHDGNFLINQLWEYPDRCLWQPPAGYTSYFCNNTLTACSGCNGGGGLEEKCLNSSESFLHAGQALYSQRYCYFCSSDFVSLWNLRGKSSPDPQGECRAPETAIDLFPGYNAFEFTVIFSLRGKDMHLALPETKSYSLSYAWSELECSDADLSCSASSCVNGIAPQKGRCDEFLDLSVLWIQVCLGADSAADAARQSSCVKNLPHVTSAMLVDTIWPLTQNCLQAGHVSRDFRVTSVNAVERSKVLELYIQFVYNRAALRGYGHIRLRNCVLVAVSRWLYTLRDVLPQNDDVIIPEHHRSALHATNQDGGDGSEMTMNTVSFGTEEDNGGDVNDDLEDSMREGLDFGGFSDDINPAGRSTNTNTGEKREGTSSETYVCFQILIGARTVDGTSVMSEGDCFLALDMAIPIAGRLAKTDDRPENRSHRLRCADSILVSLVLVFLARAIRFEE